tara:strand:- start:7458 stop:9560 length:2103 start_codon:yes stop_codon:yes gene_type:complete
MARKFIRTRKTQIQSLSSVILLCLSAVAFSQEASQRVLTQRALEEQESTGRIFLVNDFAQYAPRNALDMLEQVPGFVVRDDDQGRGLGQANTNVLINGVRLSSKSQDIRDQLRRVNVDNVEQIAIIDGATLEIPGLSGQVANVTTRGGETSGRFEYRNNYRPDYEPSWFGGEISISSSTGNLEWNAAFTHNTNRGGALGPSIISDGSGTITEVRDVYLHSEGEYPALSGNLKWNAPGGSIANFNARYEKTYRDFSNDEQRNLVNGVDRFRDFDNKDRDYEYELGADLDFAFGPGRMKVIGLQRLDDSNTGSYRVLVFEDASPSTGNRFLIQAETTERIARGEYRWNALGGNWQLDAEAAFNELDQSSQLFNLDNTGAFIEVPFPGGTGGVTEDRYEMILNHGRTFDNGVTFQLGLGAENSELEQTGPGGLTRTFWRPKGSFALAWAPQEGLDISLNIARKVDQLSFGDFLAEVFLEDQNANAGNAALKPTLSWESDLELNKNLGRLGSTTLKFYAQWFDDYIDIIPLPGGGESPGNIDSAELYGLEWNSTFNFDSLGWQGAKLDLEITLEESEVNDPLTGEARAFSRHYDRELDIDLRHDIAGTDWAWGVGLEYNHVLPSYRLSEVNREYEGPIYSFGFVEHKDVFGLTVNLQIFNLTDGRAVLDRTVYTGPRDSSLVLFRENHELEVGPIYRLQLTGSF